jgi:hypothetical protein
MKNSLLGDEDFDHIAVAYLKEWGYDVVTIQDLGLARIRFPDEAVLRKAIELDRVLLTHNRRHFMWLHKQNSAHAGIVVCTQTVDHPRLAEKIATQLERHDSIAGKLLRVYRDA